MVVKRRSFTRARKAAGYTQEGLAERLGVDRTTVARWEGGENEPHPWQRPKIAEAFGLSLGEFNGLLDEVGTTGHTVEVSAAPHGSWLVSRGTAYTTSSRSCFANGQVS